MRLHEGERIAINIAGIQTVELCAELGKGTFGHVWKAKSVSSKQTDYYVIKHFNFAGEEKRRGYNERIRREASVAIDSPHVIKCLGYCEPERDHLLLLFPYEPGQDLAKWLAANANAAWPVKKRIFLDILRGVHALHRANILHRDLKPQNILVTEPALTSRLIDFGLAKFRDLESLTSSGVQLGTYAYMAPEMLIYGAKEVDEHYDVYALGVILYELMAGKHPWISRGWNIGEFFQLVRQSNNRHLLDIAPLRFTEDANALEAIRRSTMFDLKERLRSVKAMFELLNDDPYFTIDLGNGIMLEMIAIPGGTFWMGQSDEQQRALQYIWQHVHLLKREDGHQKDQRPCHQVTVAPFWMGKYPVTQAQWQAIMGNNPSHHKGAEHPVERVSWNDVQEFCQRLSQKTGKTFRLPSEAEWEYACRAETQTLYYFGNNPAQLNLYAWYDDKSNRSRFYDNSFHETHPVGQKKPNAFGLYDMYGNVEEWCQDVWQENYNGAPIDGSAWEQAGHYRVKRGGAANTIQLGCYSAARHNDLPTANDSSYTGLRLVVSRTL